MKQTGRPGGKGSAGRKVLIILLTFLLIFLILVLISIGYTLVMLGKINYVGHQEATISPAELEYYVDQNKDAEIPEGQDIRLDTLPGEKIENQNMIHILLIGEDARLGEGRGRSDAMILCSIDTVKRKLMVISFMRDMYVTIPGYTDHKLNSAYAWGGMKLLSETLLLNFGIKPNACFAVNFQAFETVIDRLGGVDIILTAEEAKYIGCGQGINHLNGREALTYARIRSIGQGDFDRTARQRRIIQALIDQTGNIGAVQCHLLLEDLLPMVQTNAEREDVLSYSLALMPILTGEYEVEKLCIPAEETYEYAWAKGMSVLLIDLKQNQEILRKALSENR